MSDRPQFRRRHYFIKKRFQIDFSIKFLIIIVIEAIMTIGLFFLISRGTLTTGYVGSELKITHTYDFFIPTLLLANIVIVGLTGLIGIAILIFMSHRIAGPFYRFEKVLDEIGKGDLTHRVKLRQKDQFHELAEGINLQANTLDSSIGALKSGVNEISDLLSAIKAIPASNPSRDEKLERLLQEISKKILELQGAVNYFKTSQDQQANKPPA